MAAGDTATLTLKVKIEDGWHTYGLKEYLNAEGIGPQKTEITLDIKEATLISTKIKTSKPLAVYDSAFEVNVEKFKHNADFTLPITTKRSLKAGTYKGNVLVYYQVCNAQSCLPATEIKLPITLNVTSSSKTDIGSESDTSSSKAEVSVPSDNNQSTSGTTNSGQQLSQAQTITSGTTATASATNSTDAPPTDFLGLIFWAIGWGIVSWVMPCVYPMIPITVSFFTKRSEKEKTSPVTDALVYSAGIMSTYILFGVVLNVVIALIFGQAQANNAGRNFATNPFLNLFLSAMFIIIAGNLFGMYELALPARWVNALNRKSNQSKGYSASFIMGMVFSLTSLTCTIAFISQVQAMAAGNPVRAIFAMTVYAAIFALPFFLLALFPAAISKLPRSGAWMNNIKVMFGFVEIAFAVSYFARVDSILGWQFISREVVLAAWAGCSILMVLYMLGTFRMKLDSPTDHIGGIRATFAVALAALTFFFFNGMQGNSVGSLEPFIYVESFNTNRQNISVTALTTEAPGSTELVTHEGWTEDLDKALQYAKKKGKAVFVDFTGVSCTNCRQMEKNMFPRQQVKELMSKMVLVRCYTDRRYNPMDAKYQQMQAERFNSTELPLYVILSGNNEVIATSSYTSNEQEFISFLKKANSNETASLR